MKKGFFKLFNSVLFLISLLFLSSSNVLAESIIGNYQNETGVVMTQADIKRLKNLGFDDTEIEYMEQEEFDENHELQGEVVASTTKYYKVVSNYFATSIFSENSSNEPEYITLEITKEEYDNIEEDFELINGISNDNYKEMTTTIVKLSSGNYRYKNTVRWKKIPKVRHKDIISIAIEESKVYPVNSSKQIRSVFSYTKNNASTFVATGANDAEWSLSPEGYTAKFKLAYTSSYDSWYSLQSYMYFNVEKQNSNSTITSLSAYGNYRHATSYFTDTSFSFGISFHAISISASYDKKYDSMSTAQETLANINW